MKTRSALFGLSIALALALGAAAFSSFPAKDAYAQTPSNPAPYNVDVGAVITNALRTAGTTTTAALANTNWRGVTCRSVITASSGSTSYSWGIQTYDAATATWVSYLTAATLTTLSANVAPGVAYDLTIAPGIQTTSLPSNTAALNFHVPRTWRVTQTIGGSSGPAVTSKIGCNYLL